MTECTLCGKNHDLGGYLCDKCGWALVEDLKSIPQLVIDLATHGIAYEAVDKYAAGYITFTPADVNLISLLDHRSGITRTLRDWAHLIGAELGATVKPDTLNLGQLLQQHLAWHTWIAGNFDMAGDYATEVRDRVRQMRRAVEGPTHRVRVGHCPVIHPDTGEECGKVLTAEPETDTIRCPRCETTWTADKNWRLLGRAVS